jgi:hypothetical protein
MAQIFFIFEHIESPKECVKSIRNTGHQKKQSFACHRLKNDRMLCLKSEN